MKFKWIIIFVLFASFSIQAQTVDEILSKYFQAMGGVEKLKAVKTVKTTGKMTMQGMDLNFTMTTKTPNKQRMTIAVQGQEIVQAYDGTDAWMLNPLAGGKEPSKMPAELAKEMAEQKIEDEFIDYQKKGHEVKLLGKEDVDGTSCYKIEIIRNKFNDAEDIQMIYYIDAENYVPIMTSSFARTGPMKGMESRNYMSDYQEVNGLMFPFSLETKVNGQTATKMTFQTMTINENVDDAIFAFPKK